MHEQREAIMPDKFPSLQKPPSRAELLTIVAAATVLTGWSIALAANAYISTPDIANFRRFAEPASSKFEPKSWYLFGPVLFEVVGLLGAAVPFLPRRIRNFLDPGIPIKRVHAYGLLAFFVVGLWGTGINSSRALQATHRVDHLSYQHG
jgi:hypothetical protein